MQSARLLDRFDIRTPELSDAAALAAAYDRNREHLAPYEPRRTPAFYTTVAQREALAVTLEAARHRRSAGWLIFDEARVIGRINLNSIVLGAAHCGHVGYWVDAEYTGLGLATASTEFACAAAARLGLHRVEAGTLTDNAASKAVLRKCGFEPIGHAPKYLHINGAWRDHDLFQRILHDRPPE